MMPMLQVWRVKLTLAKVRNCARELLTLPPKDPRRIFQGNALLRRLVRNGVLSEDKMKLDYVLALKVKLSQQSYDRLLNLNGF